ncbi:MAG: hypothetical protein Q7S37_05235 [bacterium]|nr:hypothetical protein [bacterium]
MKKCTDITKKNIKKKYKHIERLAPKESINWEAAEFHYYSKNQYWIFGIVILILGLSFLFVAAAQYFGYQLTLADYSLILVMILLIFVFAQYGHIEPRKFKAELGQNGVVIMGYVYSYDKLKSFWITEQPSPVAHFEKVEVGLPLSLLLEDQPVEEVRHFLLRYLPEHPTASEHVTDKVRHFLRF